METFCVDETQNEKRLDIVLSTHNLVSSRSVAKKMINSGKVKINSSDENITPKKTVRTRDIISFSLLPEVTTDIIPVAHPLDIIFEDDFLIIVNKPSGMVVHPAAGHHSDTLVNYLAHHTSLSNPESSRPGIVHRIDKDTSGLLVVAKDNETHENLAKQFERHSIQRIYQAIIWGVPKTGKGRIDQPIGRHPANRKKFAVRGSGKNAVTHWQILKRFTHLCLIECQLETGRTHQIRVHLNSIGHSVLGDPVYGRFRTFAKKYPEELKNTLKQVSGQSLHAISLGFIHPKTHEDMNFQSALPIEMQKVLSVLNTCSLEL